MGGCVEYILGIEKGQGYSYERVKVKRGGVVGR
jgi:hypothetical protein